MHMFYKSPVEYHFFKLSCHKPVDHSQAQSYDHTYHTNFSTCGVSQCKRLTL